MNILNMMGANVGMNPVNITIIRKSGGGEIINGRYHPGPETEEPKTVTLQPLNNKEMQHVSGIQRISDVRKFYLNDGSEVHAENGDKVRFNGEIWSVVESDVRPWHNYCKAIITREDPRKA